MKLLKSLKSLILVPCLFTGFFFSPLSFSAPRPGLPLFEDLLQGRDAIGRLHSQVTQYINRIASRTPSVPADEAMTENNYYASHTLIGLASGLTVLEEQVSSSMDVYETSDFWHSWKYICQDNRRLGTLAEAGREIAQPPYRGLVSADDFSAIQNKILQISQLLKCSL